jgi:HEAT repeat protein
VAFVTSVAIAMGSERLACAEEAHADAGGAAALRDLLESTDFRVRTNAALFVGRVRLQGGREALERALEDPHPTVRGAAASALVTFGDSAATVALERRLAIEPAAAVRARIQAALDGLRGVTASPAADTRRALSSETRVVLRLGTMRNNSGIRGDELRRVLHDAARDRARSLRGTEVTDSDAALLAQAAARHVPVVTLDGLLSHLTESLAEGQVQVRAMVEFALRREQELRGLLSGAATSFGSGDTISEQGRRRLQDDAVDGAVQSALRGVETLIGAVH